MPIDASGTSDNEFDGLYGDGAKEATNVLMNRLGITTRLRPPAPPAPPIDTPPRGGDDDGMDNHEARIQKIEETLPTLATKADVIELRLELRADFAVLRADISDAIKDMHRWTHTALLGVLGTSLLGIGGLIFTIYNSTKPVPQREQAPPIIIAVPQTVQPPPASTK